jgi:methylmalonyl-CoA mutase C-terminal domain/subunit
MERHVLRVLMVTPGLDGHWRGKVAVSTALRDAGMEVIYGGNMEPHEIAEVAIQEDVDVIGLSILSAAHLRLIEFTLKGMEEKGVRDIPVVVGGTILEEDVPEIKKMGIVEVFGPGTPMEEIIKFFQNL